MIAVLVQVSVFFGILLLFSAGNFSLSVIFVYEFKLTKQELQILSKFWCFSFS